MDLLEKMGVGDTFGSIDVVALTTTKPIRRDTRLKKKRKYIMHGRLSIEEIYEIIDGDSHLTFDYLLNTAFAATISAVGLACDSSPTVVASMLVSPLMGPIMGIAFGLAVRDRHLVLRCLRNEVIGASLTIFIGALVGAVVAQFYGPYCEKYNIDTSWCFGDLSSIEIESRGNPRNLIAGLCIALPAGGAGAMALMGNGNAAIVGVGIAVALLPPLTNSGLTFAMALTYFIQPPAVLIPGERHIPSHPLTSSCIFSHTLARIPRIQLAQPRTYLPCLASSHFSLFLCLHS
jgi:uncharacterized hydrophobic protein (TIGR00271 family)